MDGYFSLLWESEEAYGEWCRSLHAGDKGYIADLNLKFVYEEVYRAGRFWERYGFEEIFLHPCVSASTVIMRQGIMKQFFRDTLLYEAASEFVDCISTLQKRLERMESPSAKDEKKKMLSALQIRYDFLVSMGRIHDRVSGYLQKKTPLSEGIERLAGFLFDEKAVSEKEQLSDFLSALDRSMPSSLILNKNGTQVCQNIVIDPEGSEECEYTERLKACAEPFLGQYDFKIGVYQNTDISHLDKRIQEYLFRQRPQLEGELKGLYQKYGEYNISRFVQAAKELVFYLACVRFVRKYEKAGFFFCMPEIGMQKFDMTKNCTPESDTPACGLQQDSELIDSEVREAYDMTLGINLYRADKGCKIVPNDYRIDEKRRLFILTGANQGGKTTFVRSMGLIQCMAQIGMFVPCRKASLRLVRQIHTHFSREDESGAVVGRFEQELQRMQEILKSLQDGDMVLLNETFTSTQRATAVILLKQLLSEMNRRRCLGGLVTHFYEVCEGLTGEGFYSLTTEVSGDGEYKERTYRIRDGESSRYSYARDIAVRCGVTYEKLTGDCLRSDSARPFDEILMEERE